MKYIDLVDNLSLKKLDPNNKKDVKLISTLNKDPLVGRKKGYFYSLKDCFDDLSYLDNEEIYDSQFSIYNMDNPIGYMKISKIIEASKMVILSYALLKRARGHGYMTKVLREVTKMILQDQKRQIEAITLIVDVNNKESQRLVERVSFVSDGLSNIDHLSQGYITYVKTKQILRDESKKVYKV